MMIPRTLSDHTYWFGRKRWVKSACKWRTPTPEVCKKDQSSFKLNTAGHFQAQTIQGVVMFGSGAQEATKTKSSLSAAQDLPSHQNAPKAQVKATKKPVRWSKFRNSR